MKKNLGIVVFILTLFSCQSAKHSFSIVNPSEIKRNYELIVLKRADIEKKIGLIPEGKFISIITIDKKEIVAQHDDLNSDGIWDEVAFLLNINSKEEQQFRIKVSDIISIPEVQRAHVRLRKKEADTIYGENIMFEKMPFQNPPTDFKKQAFPLYLTEGPTWENDKVAFRLFFDMRNRKDVFGKLVPEMIMDTIGLNPQYDYHYLADWGMDILHVGTSLGAGSIALFYKENGKDTLVIPAGANIKKQSFRKISSGHVRAMFEITYECQLGENLVKIIDEISIWGGKYFYQSRLKFENAPNDLRVFTGIANFYQNDIDSFTVENTSVLLTHGKQSENHDYLGLAILASKENIYNFDSNAIKVADSQLLGQNLNKNQGAEFRFYACWEKTDSLFSDMKSFENFLILEAKNYSQPLIIQW
jgi:hypothetical protein